MRRAFGIAVGALLLTGAGCTFLISFDDLPAIDAGSFADTSVLPPVTGTDTGTAVDSSAAIDAGPPVPVTPACDTTFPLTQIMGCDALVEGGQVCADSALLTAYPGDRTKDVVTCSKAGATCVRHCIACAHLPSGFPDQCDQCVGKANGKYCGTDMGWQPENFRLLVTCTNDRMAVATPCSTRGCDSKGGTGDAACKP